MPIPDLSTTLSGLIGRPPATGLRRLAFAAAVFALVALAGPGCKQDAANEASDSDANGYLCAKCGVKLYTDRSVFIGPRCPKCGEDTLVEVVGYRCARDQFVTMRSARGDSRGVVCEKCQASLANAMFLPRATELQAWGATKTTP